jgi:hypothetical protein
MICATCFVEIPKAEVKNSATAGNAIWCPKCVKRLKLNLKSKDRFGPSVHVDDVVVPEVK